jgi:cell division protein ZapE
VPAEQLYTSGPHAEEFTRTVSRLVEMNSSEYLTLPHLTQQEEAKKAAAGAIA